MGSIHRLRGVMVRSQNFAQAEQRWPSFHQKRGLHRGGRFFGDEYTSYYVSLIDRYVPIRKTILMMCVSIRPGYVKGKGSEHLSVTKKITYLERPLWTAAIRPSLVKLREVVKLIPLYMA